MAEFMSLLCQFEDVVTDELIDEISRMCLSLVMFCRENNDAPRFELNDGNCATVQLCKLPTMGRAPWPARHHEMLRTTPAKATRLAMKHRAHVAPMAVAPCILLQLIQKLQKRRSFSWARIRSFLRNWPDTSKYNS